MFRKSISLIITFTFLFSLITPVPKVQAQPLLGLPEPGTMVNLSPAYQPAIIKGVTVHKDNPFLFDFIVDVGQDHLQGEALKKEGEKLIKYFLASLAIPEKDLWVNLSPYEKDRTIPEALGQTEMGRDLLAQDYILKQITASLIYPEKELGKVFWDRIYTKVQQMYGTTQVPVNTFNKVWIMVDKAEVFEHNQTAFVIASHLKVMLEEDYLALQKHNKTVTAANTEIHSMSSQIVKDIILPELEHEVNFGKNFAVLRQITNSLILASWYKNNLKQAILNQVYADKEKIKGIDLQDTQVREKIYERYLQAYKKGVFNFIKEDQISDQGTTISRKYFSGGWDPAMAAHPVLTLTETLEVDSALTDGVNLAQITAGVNVHPIDQAMIGDPSFNKRAAMFVRYLEIRVNQGQSLINVEVMSGIVGEKVITAVIDELEDIERVGESSNLLHIKSANDLLSKLQSLETRIKDHPSMFENIARTETESPIAKIPDFGSGDDLLRRLVSEPPSSAHLYPRNQILASLDQVAMSIGGISPYQAANYTNTATQSFYRFRQAFPTTSAIIKQMQESGQFGISSVDAPNKLVVRLVVNKAKKPGLELFRRLRRIIAALGDDKVKNPEINLPEIIYRLGSPKATEQIQSKDEPKTEEKIRVSEKVRRFKAWAEEHRGQTMDESQKELGQRFGLSWGTISKILSTGEYGIKTGARKREFERVKQFKAWAEVHRGQEVKETQVQLGQRFKINPSTLNKILQNGQYNITTGVGISHDSEKGKRFKVWAEDHRGQTVDETQMQLGQGFGLSTVTISAILSAGKYGIITGGGSRESEGTKRFKVWAQEHRGQEVEETQTELGERFGLSPHTINKFLSEGKYGITTNVRSRESEEVKRLRVWAEDHRGQTVSETREDLAGRFGLTLGTINRILSRAKGYDVKTAFTRASEEAKALKAWAEEHRGQKVAETQQQLAERFRLTQRSVKRILSDGKYGITLSVVSRESEKTKRFKAWAEENRGRSVPQSQLQLGQQFGLSQWTINNILSKGQYGIKTGVDPTTFFFDTSVMDPKKAKEIVGYMLSNAMRFQPNTSALSVAAATYIMDHPADFHPDIFRQAPPALRLIASTDLADRTIRNKIRLLINAADVILTSANFGQETSLNAARQLRLAWRRSEYKDLVAPVLLQHTEFKPLHQEAKNHLMAIRKNNIPFPTAIRILKVHDEAFKQLFSPAAQTVAGIFERYSEGDSKGQFNPRSIGLIPLYEILDLVFSVWNDAENLGLGPVKEKAQEVWENMAKANSFPHRFMAALLILKYSQIFESEKPPAKSSTRLKSISRVKSDGRTKLEAYLEEHRGQEIPEKTQKELAARFGLHLRTVLKVLSEGKYEVKTSSSVRQSGGLKSDGRKKLEAYLEEHRGQEISEKTQKELATRFGTSRRTVFELLNKGGYEVKLVPILPKDRPSRNEVKGRTKSDGRIRLETYLEEHRGQEILKKTGKELAEKFGVFPSTVYQVLSTEKYDVKFAPASKKVQPPKSNIVKRAPKPDSIKKTPEPPQKESYSNDQVEDVLTQVIDLLKNKPTVQLRDILYYNFRSRNSLPLDILWQLSTEIPKEKYENLHIINIRNLGANVVQFQISNNSSEDRTFKLRNLFETMKNLVSKRIDELGKDETIDTESIVHQALANAAMMGNLEDAKGGIDLNTGNVNWKISKDGKGVEMNIDPAMIERIKHEGIDSLTPVIFRITPIQSIWPIIGLDPPKQEVRLAGV